MLALALNIRAGALTSLGYFGLLVITFVIRERNWNWRRLADTAGRLAVVTVAALLLGTILWPWAGAAALKRLVLALLSFSESSDGPRVLYAGQWLYDKAIPRTYAPWWILISTPPVVLAGLAAALIFGVPNRGHAARRRALWVVALLPVALVVANRSPLYDGIRHLLFVYPVLVVLSASGWMAWLSQRRPWLRRSAVVLLIAGLLDIIVFVVRFHPYETIYFNELVGGPRGAFARYDMDYWGNCLHEAVAWSAETARLSRMPIAIGASHEPRPSLRWETERFTGVFWAPAHNYIDIRLNRGTAVEVAQMAKADALYRVTSPDGVVLCVVLPGPQFDELKPRLSMPDKTFPRRGRWR